MKGNYLPEKGYMRVIVICFYILLGTATIYVTYRYLLRLILPFLIAWILSMLIHPSAVWISRKTKIPRKYVAAFLISVIIIVVGGSAYYIIQRVVTELGKFIGSIGENYDNIINNVKKLSEKIETTLPFSDKKNTSDFIVKYASDIVRESVQYISSKLPSVIGKSASALPEIVLFVAMLIISSYYMSSELPRINAALAIFLPQKAVMTCQKIKVDMKNSCMSYIKAYSLLMVVTFMELLAGFLVLGIDYAFTIALFSAIADMLPVIGLGIILLPWAIVLLLYGNYYVGIGLIIIYIVTAFIRQIIEPKIVGRSIGLHPLVTLISMYVGLRLMGIMGMLIMPVSVIILKNICQNEFKKFEKTKNKLS